MGRIFSATFLILATFVAARVFTPSESKQSDSQEVAIMLDDWYDAARKGDDQRYFKHFDDNALFLGTDPDERWTLKDFHDKYPKPSWTYKAEERHVFFSMDHKIGWFDEKLRRTPVLGPMRATGVVVKSQGTWKIEQYNLTFLVPNAVFGKLQKGQSCRPVWRVRCEDPAQQCR